MTKQTSTSASIDNDANYRITLASPVTVNGIKLLPRGEITLRGDLLKTLTQENPDVVLSAAAVA